MNNELHFEFTSELIRQEHGFRYHIVLVPENVATAYKNAGISRVIGTFGQFPFRLALVSDGDGGLFLTLNLSYKRKLKINEGENVFVTIKPDPEPDEYPMAEELNEVFAQDEVASNRFFGMTIGKQRSLASYVTSAKSVDTRIKRALDLAEKLRNNNLYSDKQDK